jgi:V/A-type H+-transporting ATPase subunit I
MIVQMDKAFVVCRASDRRAMLSALQDAGVLHVSAIDPSSALAPADSELVAKAGRLDRALQVLSSVTAASGACDVSAEQAADETLAIQRRLAEREAKLTSLQQQLESIRVWGDVELRQFDALRAAGVNVGFYVVRADDVDRVSAECVVPIETIKGGRVIVAAASRNGELVVPEGAEVLPLPQRDAPSIRAEAAAIDAEIRSDRDRLAVLATTLPAMRAVRAVMDAELDFSQVMNNAASNASLFAVQGWVPTDRADDIRSAMTRAGVHAGVHTQAAADDENPPTLLRCPKWAEPIHGLLKILGTVPGYREFDVSVPFMLALPIFTAMLIGDAGYGAVLFLGLLAFWKKVAPAMGEQFSKLLVVMSVLTFLWGASTSTFFGFQLYTPLIPVDVSEESRQMMMRISFYMGAIHLSLAQLWQAKRLFPKLKFLCRLGWATFVWGMFGVVQMFVFGLQLDWQGPYLWFLTIGGGLAILFDSPSRNPLKMVLMGLANFPLAMLGAFSDVISYVRLMAVGLAGSVLAQSFNQLAFDAGILPVTILVMVLGHSLNLALGLIALFAHGVRLNMLEFSNHLGVQWGGYGYKAFAKVVPVK